MAFPKKIMRKIVSPASHLIKECVVKCFNYIRRKYTFEQVEEETYNLKHLEQEQRKKASMENNGFDSNSMEKESKECANFFKKKRGRRKAATPTPISIAKDYMGAQSHQQK